MFLRQALTRAPLARRSAQNFAQTTQKRTFVSRSKPKRGHGLEDYYDFPEFQCKMNSPMGPYAFLALCNAGGWIVIGPLLHSNYYYSGRVLPKPESATQLCDDSW